MSLVCACETADGRCAAARVMDGEIRCETLDRALDIAKRAGWGAFKPARGYYARVHYSRETREKALLMLREGAWPSDVGHALHVHVGTIHQWRRRANIAPTARKGEQLAILRASAAKGTAASIAARAVRAELPGIAPGERRAK